MSLSSLTGSNDGLSNPGISSDQYADDDIRVFVYGTLKPGECNYLRYCEGHVTDQFDAIAYGDLYHLPVGYPAMTMGDRPVHGAVLSLDSLSTLHALDGLEDYDPSRLPDENDYNRTKIEVFDGQGVSRGVVWVYLMNKDKVIQQGGSLLPEGIWLQS
jgi:gamma-glutamylcyclotransferase (GGCT)/AIG2-like uncharacterized protein YtfP